MKQLHWLIGEWQRTNEVPERVSLELWELQEDGHLAGVGLTTEGDKVLFKEQLKLQIKGDKVQYIAIVPHNNQPTIFELTDLQENVVVFENPEHDFPKKISYELMTADSMKAIISGNGKEIVFVFKRLQ
ncbi:MAG: DUF6265 family protein [Chitinophagales bacterium]